MRSMVEGALCVQSLMPLPRRKSAVPLPRNAGEESKLIGFCALHA
jgi:hypothetical protein